MKMKKRPLRTLSVLLTVAVLLGVLACLPVGAGGVSDYDWADRPVYASGDYLYSTSGDHAVIRKYIGNSKEIITPTTLGGCKVVGIGNFAFEGNETLTSVVISEGVTYTGEKSFDGCSNLKILSLPSSLNSINCSFKDCANLSKIFVSPSNKYYKMEGNCLIRKYDDGGDYLLVGFADSKIPDGVEYIEAYAFANRTDLKSILIPSGVTRIDEYAFAGCTNLSEVFLPDSLGYIGFCAFKDCTSLENIFIPAGVGSFGGNPFCGCKNLKITVATTNPDLYVVRNCLIDKTDGGLITGNANGFIPSGVKGIARGAFYGPDITSVHIPASVESFGGDYYWCPGGFGDCPNLKELTVAQDNPIYYASGNCIINKENDILEYGCAGSVIPNGVKEIGEKAFYNCIGLTNLTIPSTCTIIGPWAFEGCSSLTTLDVNQCTEIRPWAFEGCINLTALTVDQSNPIFYASGNCIITKADDILVAGCSSSIIPSRVKEIGSRAFYGSGLKSIVIPDTVKVIQESAFSDCKKLINVTIGTGVEEIGSWAFLNCTRLTKLYIPHNVTILGDTVFDGCSNLIDIYCEAESAPEGWSELWIGADYGDFTCPSPSVVHWGEEMPEMPAMLLGDLSGDGKTNSTDYMLLKRHVLGTYKLSDAYLAFADFSGDGKVNSTDYMLLKRAVLGTYKLAAK